MNSIQILNNTVNGQYGVVNIVPGGKGTPWTPFIEDAKVAVDVQNWSIPGTNAVNILTADEVTFNHNLISIRLNGYGQNQNNYPFIIQNSLFTSRNIPFSLLNWPKTATVKNSTNVGGNTMQTPYINNSLYLPSGITFSNSVFFGQFPTNGIVLTNIGVTTVSVFPTYREISIGQNGPPNFNCFDNLQEDITANNSNLTVVNSVFQNGRQGGKGGIQFGKAIVATSTNSSDGFSNNRIRIMAGNNQGNFNCRFYEKVACADITGYLDNQILFTESYSNANDYSTFNNNALPGNRGFNIRTNRFVNIILQNNKLYNIRNSMLVSLFDGLYSVGNQQGFTRYVGLIQAQNNLVDRYVGVPPGGLKPFVNIGLSIADVINSNATGFSPGPVFVDASINNFANVHNGIDTRNFAYCSVGVTSNTIGLLNEPSLNPLNIQNGIQAISNLKIIGVNANNIVGPVNYAPSLKGISTWNNLMLSVRCNTTAETERGIEFNRAQIVAAFEDNVMKDNRFGLVLDNQAVLTGTNNQTILGTANRPTDNIWIQPWPAGKFQAFTTGFSSAQNGRLVIQNTPTPSLNPSGLSTTSGFQGCPVPAEYNPNCSPFNTLINAAITEQPTCRINNNNNGGGNNGAVAMMEQIVTSSFNYSANVNEAQFQDKTFSYRGLKGSPNLMNGSNILTSFYSSGQNNCMQAFCGMEDNIMNKNFNAAQSQISVFTPTNNIESNYKNYYQVLLNAMDSSYNSNDSLTLWNIANLCPLTDGAVVFQAQAAYNSLYNGYYKFNGNCGGNNNVRLINPVASAAENLTEKTVLKTELFPNPNDGNFVIRLRTSVEKQGAEIRIFDITGRELYKENRTIETGEELKMTNNLLNGTYFVKVKFEDGSVDIHKLIVNK